MWLFCVGMPVPPSVPAEDLHHRPVPAHTQAAEAGLGNHVGFCCQLISGVAVLPSGGGE